MKVAVLGGGNAGWATSAHLSLMGFDVCLCDLPEFSDTIEPVKKYGGIEIKQAEGVEIRGLPSGFAKIDCVTTDVSEAVRDADLIFVLVPSYGQMRFAEAITPHLRDGQVVVFTPGNLASIEVWRMWRRIGFERDVVLAETNTLPYLCFKSAYLSDWNIIRQFVVRPTIWIGYYKEKVRFSAFPAKDTDRALKVVREVYPRYAKAKNVFETSLTNPNVMLHPAISLLNTGWIEATRWGFKFYTEGVTPSIGRVIEALESERLAVGRGLGIDLSYMDWLVERGGVEFKGRVHEVLRGDKALTLFSELCVHEIDTDLNFMFITEDVPYGLVPWASLAEKLGVETPIIRALIAIASAVNETDYWSVGRSLERLGMGEMSVEEVKSFVENGLS